MLGAFSQRRCSMAGEQHDRNGPRSWLALQILNQVPTVTATQREVRDDYVWMEIPSPAVCLLAISGLDCLETESDKALDVQFTRVDVIVDDEYQRSGRRGPGTTAIHGCYGLKKIEDNKNIASLGTDLSRF